MKIEKIAPAVAFVVLSVYFAYRYMQVSKIKALNMESDVRREVGIQLSKWQHEKNTFMIENGLISDLRTLTRTYSEYLLTGNMATADKCLDQYNALVRKYNACIDKHYAKRKQNKNYSFC